MLDLIRKKQKTVVLKFVFWAIIAAFVGTIFLVWGKGSGPTGGDNAVAATVNGTKIDMKTFQQVYANLYKSYQNIYGESFTPVLEKKLQIKRQAINILIEQALLVEAGERLGVTVSAKELVDSIAAIPAFQTQGTFDRERYVRILGSQRMTPELFEKSQRAQLIIQKTRERLNDDVEVSEQDIEEAFRRQEEKINLAFIHISPALVEDEIEVTDETLSSFYTEKKENFRVPEKVRLAYMVFDSATYLPQVTVAPEDLQKFYQRHLERFDIKEKVRMAHIFFRMAQDADEQAQEDLLKKAQGVLAKARQGEDFAALAKQFSEDTNSAQNGGELGEFPRGSLTSALEKTVFDLDKGEISDIVQTPAGYHIVKALDHTPAGLLPLEQVRTEVEKEVRGEKALAIALDKAMDAYNINRKSGNLKAASEANNFEIKTTELFARGEAVPEIDAGPEIANRAFSFDAGNLTRPMVLDNRVILAAVTERQPSRIPELSEVRQEVVTAFRRDKAAVRAEDMAQSLIKELAEGGAIEEAAERYNLDVLETGFFSRTENPFIPNIGNSGVWFDKVFELSETQPLLQQPLPAGESLLVVSLKEKEKADMNRLDEETRKNLRQTVKVEKQQTAFASKLQALKEKAEITLGTVIQDDLRSL